MYCFKRVRSYDMLNIDAYIKKNIHLIACLKKQAFGTATKSSILLGLIYLGYREPLTSVSGESLMLGNLNFIEFRY